MSYIFQFIRIVVEHLFKVDESVGKREEEGPMPNEEPLHRSESMGGGLREHENLRATLIKCGLKAI